MKLQPSLMNNSSTYITKKVNQPYLSLINNLKLLPMILIIFCLVHEDVFINPTIDYFILRIDRGFINCNDWGAPLDVLWRTLPFRVFVQTS